MATPCPKDAAFLLTVGSFLLTVEFIAYSCAWEVFRLQSELLYLQILALGKRI